MPRERAAAPAEFGIEEDRLRIAYTRGLLYALDLDMLVQLAERHSDDDLPYYSLKAGHPYAVQGGPNNLYKAIAHAVPIVYRRQGEPAVVGDDNAMGQPFEDTASCDVAVDRLRDGARRASVRATLRGLQYHSSWRAARSAFLDVYRTILTKKARREAKARSAGANGAGKPVVNA